MLKALAVTLMSAAAIVGFAGTASAQSAPKATLCTGPTSLRYRF